VIWLRDRRRSVVRRQHDQRVITEVKGVIVSTRSRVMGFVVATLLGASAVVVGTVGAAQAAGSPFDPGSSGATQGTLSFYDSSGTQITSGPLNTPPAYVMANSWTGRTGTKYAYLYAATPVSGADSGTWPNDLISVGTQFPDASAPGALKNNPNVLASQVLFWFDAAGYPATYPNTNSDPAWQNLYQLRLEDTGPGISIDPQTYASATISVDTAAGTWTQVYPNPNALPPGVTSAASVSGKVQVGSKVSCAVTFSGADSVAYKWQRDGKNISGATTSKYSLVSADYNHKIGCVATGSNANGDTASKSPTKKVALGPALTATKAPTISGTPKVGKTLTCKPGAWSPKASSYSYQWKLNGKAIKGATKSKYKLTSKDKGKKITCTVTAKKAGYANAVKTTKAVKVS
jgi:hypothetical protein